jgi:hypothetical protein
VRSAAIVLGLLLAAPAAAQDAGTDPELEAWHRMVREDPFTDRADDPIGLDARDEELRTMRLPEPEEIVEERIPPVIGDVLTAIPGVRETRHAVSIELREGLAIVREEMAFESSARLAAEVRYRVGIPERGALVALEACTAAGCRTGLPERRTGALSAYDDAARGRGAADPASPMPIAHAVLVRDERGDAVVVRAAPVIEERDPLVVRVTWAVRAPVHGGRMRLALPARGSDVRTVPLEIAVSAIDLVAPAVDGVPIERRPETRAATEPIAITAAIPQTAGVRGAAAIVPCGAGRCVRLRAVAGRPQIPASDVIVAIDASPSTVAGARGRIAPTARTLLSMLPARARVRVVVFASRAEEIGSGWSPPTAIDRAALDGAVDRELGSATRFEGLWSLVSGWSREGTRLVIVGDGGLTWSENGTAALAAARSAGVLVAAVNVADRPSTRALRDAIEGGSASPAAAHPGPGGWTVDAGAEAEEVAAGRASEPLESLLSAIVAPVAVRSIVARVGDHRVELGALRQGEEIAWEGVMRGSSAAIVLDGAATRAATPDGIGPALTALAGGSAPLVALDTADLARTEGVGSCSAQGPYPTRSAVVPREVGLALAHTRQCNPPPSTTLGARRARDERSGVPARVLLGSMRRRVIPPARACFRTDRAGRADYEERAEIRMELADREIATASVTGEITPALRECLLSAIDHLEVPGFEGRLLVRWPLYTEGVAPPPVLELAPAVADEVDRAIPRDAAVP